MYVCVFVLAPCHVQWLDQQLRGAVQPPYLLVLPSSQPDNDGEWRPCRRHSGKQTSLLFLRLHELSVALRQTQLTFLAQSPSKSSRKRFSDRTADCGLVRPHKTHAMMLCVMCSHDDLRTQIYGIVLGVNRVLCVCVCVYASHSCARSVYSTSAQPTHICVAGLCIVCCV